jgi:aspartyl-tRNA(Asn)/glutamyl-tRNA(Gln) amidotransferase subunit C
MASLSDKDVKHIALLSRLDLSLPEVKKFKKQLSSVIDFINQLSEVDTKNVEPTSQTTGLSNVWRNDQTSLGFNQEEVFFSSDNTYSGYFKVKALLSERGEK